MDDAELRRTPLHGWHETNGGRMVPFGGWQMPVQYEAGPREEHQRVRTAAGLFDTCHMGRFLVDGQDAPAFLQRVQTWDIAKLDSGRAHYAMLLREDGGVLDDIFVYRLDPGWQVLKRARESGILVSINPDAHDIEGFEDVRFGVTFARKAWLGKKDVLNTRTAEEIDAYFAERRRR